MARPKSRSRVQPPAKRNTSPVPEAQGERLVFPWPYQPWVEGVVLALLSLVLNFHRLTAQSFWSDEGNSIAQAMRSLPEIWTHAALDIHPPLYYMLLHAWTRAFGTSEFAIRSLSAVAGVAVVLLVWLLARRLWGSATARAAGVLAAFHPALVYYAQEARMYIFVVLWATLAAYAFLTLILREGRARLALPDAALVRGARHVVRSGPPRVSPRHPALLLGKWDLVLALALAAGLWTHYAFPVVMVIFALVYGGWIYTTRRTIPVPPRLIRLMTYNLAAVLLYMPWLPIALARVQAWPRPAHSLPFQEALITAWRWLALGPVPPAWLTQWLWLWSALVAVSLWPWRGRRVHWLSWAFPLLWMALPVTTMAALGIFTPAYLKFLILSVPPLLILLARGALTPWDLWRKPSARWGRVVAGVWVGLALGSVLLFQGIALVHYYYDPAAARDDYRGIVQYIEAVAGPEDGIILNAPGQWEVFRYYYRGSLPVYRLPEERPPDPHRLQTTLEALSVKHRKLFVLLWATNESDPQGIMEHWLDTHAYKALDVWRGNVRFLIYATMRTSEEGAFSRDVKVDVGGKIRLEHVAVWQREAAPGDVVQVRLRWRARAPIAQRYKVFLQLLGPGDRLVAQRDTEPAGGSYPTSTWRTDDIVEDNYGLLIPLATPPGEYRLIVGMYNPANGRRLPVRYDGWEGDFYEIPVRVIVKRPKTPPPVEVLPMRFRVDEEVGPIRVLGYNRYKRGFRHAPDTPIHPGDFVHITIYWQAKAKPVSRWRVTLSLVDGWGNAVASLQDDLAGPAYPTTEWQAGEIVRGEFDLYLPPEIKPDTYGLRLQLWKGESQVRRAIPLGTVQVSPRTAEGR